MTDRPDMSEAALTDDEVAALAQQRSRHWRAVLPTVDSTDATDLGNAVWRGERSLLARGLLEMDAEGSLALSADVRELADAGLDGDVLVSAFTGNRDLAFNATGFTYLNYRRPVDQQVLVEIVTAMGLHRFGQLDRADAARFVSELVTATHDGSEAAGGDDAADDDTLCLAFPGEDSGHRRIFAVRPGVVETAVVAPGGLPAITRATVGLHETDLAELLGVVGQVYEVVLDRS